MLVTHILSTIRAHRRYRQAIREFAQFTDRQLDDLGISRYEIDIIVSRQKAALQSVY